MKISKLDLTNDTTNIKQYKIKHSHKITALISSLLILLIAGYFLQNPPFEIMHIFLYNTPIAYVLLLILIFTMNFCSTSSIIITEESPFFIIGEIGKIKFFSSVDFNKIESVNYSKIWTIFGFNLLKLTETGKKKLAIPVDFYENKNDLIENLITVINKKTEINLNKEQFGSLLEKKHSLQFKNIIILTLVSLFLYSGLLLALNSKPQVKLNVNESLLKFGKVFNPENPKIYIKLGEIYLKETKYAKAAVVLKKAVKLDPNNDNALYSYGAANLYLSKPNEAVESLSAALKIKPGNVKYMCALAYAYSLKNDRKNALKYADLFFDKGSKDKNDYMLASNVYFQFGQLEKGFKCFVAAKRLEAVETKTKKTLKKK